MNRSVPQPQPSRPRVLDDTEQRQLALQVCYSIGHLLWRNMYRMYPAKLKHADARLCSAERVGTAEAQPNRAFEAYSKDMVVSDGSNRGEDCLSQAAIV